MASQASKGVATRASRMRSKLQSAMEATVVDLEDVSHHHVGHTAMRANPAAGGETHFNLRIVSAKFEGLSLVRRHRMVYDALSDELASGLHALSIVAKTPSEQTHPPTPIPTQGKTL